MQKVIVGIGGNLGDQRSLQARCIRMIEERLGNVLKISSGYWNEAVGMDDEKRLFLNRCIVLDTGLQPLDLLSGLESIEQEFGRSAEEKGNNMSRNLDLDIVAFGNEIVRSDRLTIPHSGFKDRLFVLLPLFEVMPEFADPESGGTVQELIAALV